VEHKGWGLGRCLSDCTRLRKLGLVWLTSVDAGPHLSHRPGTPTRSVNSGQATALGAASGYPVRDPFHPTLPKKGYVAERKLRLTDDLMRQINEAATEREALAQQRPLFEQRSRTNLSALRLKGESKVWRNAYPTDCRCIRQRREHRFQLPRPHCICPKPI
jgi:hypothetical protein